MRVVVTGGNGLVGKALQDLVESCSGDAEWVFLAGRNDVDLLDKASVVEVFERLKPDVVVHLAARCGGLYMNMEHNEAMFVDNVSMNMNVVRAAEHVGVKRFVAMLSTCVFPDPAPGLPLTEDMIHMGPAAKTHEGYAVSKRVLELHCRLSSIPETVCLIPTNIFGPWDNFRLDEAHVVPALIHKCYLAKQRGEKFVVMGSGKAKRQFIFSGDLARIVRWAAVERPSRSGHDAFICVGGRSESEEYSIQEVAEEIAKGMDYGHELVYDTSMTDGQIKKTASNRKLMAEMRFEFADFKEKLRETIEWFKEHYEVSRH